MINIINNIFFNNGYKLVEFELQQDVAEIYLFCPKDENKREEYFVTVQFRTQSDNAVQDLLEVKAQDWFEEISYSGKVDQTFEKNCTMLLCHEEDEISKQTILMIEEDQYNFKKNVIVYTQQEVVALKSYLEQKQIEKITTSIINSIINADSGKYFLEFKDNNKQQKDHYSLILKTSLKLPFVTYSPQEQQLNNLLDDFENSLSTEQSSTYSQLINSEREWTEKNTDQHVEKIWGGE